MACIALNVFCFCDGVVTKKNISMSQGSVHCGIFSTDEVKMQVSLQLSFANSFLLVQFVFFPNALKGILRVLSSNWDN